MIIANNYLDILFQLNRSFSLRLDFILKPKGIFCLHRTANPALLRAQHRVQHVFKSGNKNITDVKVCK